MSPEEFKSLYGKALAGEESWADAAKAAKDSAGVKPGGSTGNQAANQVKRARSQAVANPVQSQADTAPAAPVGRMPPPQPVATPNTQLGGQQFEADDKQPVPRVPLYTKLGGASGIGEKVTNDLSSIPNSITDFGEAAGKKIGDMWLGAGNAVANEAKFQGQPILDEAEAYRQKLMAMMGRK